MADTCLCIVVALGLVRADESLRDSAWQLVIAVLILPAILLAPLNGAISNCLPKRLVLVGAATLSLAGSLLLLLPDVSDLLCWGLVASAIVLYGPTRYAICPAAATDAHLALPRLNGWLQMGAMLAVAGGILLGAVPTYWPPLWGLGLVAVVAALPARFPSDIRRPEPRLLALAGFFRDSRRIVRDVEARGCLIGLALLRGMMIALLGMLITMTARNQYSFLDFFNVAVHVLIGLAAGSLVA